MDQLTAQAVVSDGPVLHQLSWEKWTMWWRAGAWGLLEEMAVWPPSHVSVTPARLSGRFPAPLMSKVHREAKIPRQAGRKGSREHEKQMQMLQRAHGLARNTGGEQSLGFIPSSLCVSYRCLFVNTELGVVSKQVYLDSMLPHFPVVFPDKIQFVNLIYLSRTFSFSVFIGCVAVTLRLCPLLMEGHQVALLWLDSR